MVADTANRLVQNTRALVRRLPANTFATTGQELSDRSKFNWPGWLGRTDHQRVLPAPPGKVSAAWISGVSQCVAVLLSSMPYP